MIVLELGRPPAEPLSTNEANRLHHMRRHARLAPWRELARLTALNARLPALLKGEPCTVLVDIPFTVARDRDPSNYVGTVVKAVVDGLVRAKVWPKDSPAYVTVLEPRLFVDPTGRASAAVTLEPRNAELPSAAWVEDVPTGEAL